MKVIVVGAGKLGRKLSEIMVSDNIDVTVVEKDQEAIDRISEHVDVLTVHGNGIDMSILEELNVKEYDLLVACTTTDETNTIICSLAKQLGCKKTIARVRNPEYLEQIGFVKNRMGIDHVINPELATANSIEKYLLKKHTFHSDGFARGKVQMLDFNIENLESLVGKKLMDLDGFEKLVITAISREGKIIIPNGNTKLEEYDLIYVMGKREDIEELTKKYDEQLVEGPVNKIMILGGGRIAYYLSKRLIKSGRRVTIIEKDLDVCNSLSEKLNDALIIHGDATDIQLLEDENLQDMDAVVGATNFDEANILMGVMAKQLGVGKVVSKISRENYSKIIDNLDIDAAFNPIYITSSNILKIIRGGKIVSVSLLIGGEAEVSEIVLDKKLSILNLNLEELELPEGMIIGAIVRDDRVFIPDGKSQLKADDRIVVFTLKENIDDLKMFFKPKKGGLLSGLWSGTKDIR